jgi:hypothetical protein
MAGARFDDIAILNSVRVVVDTSAAELLTSGMDRRQRLGIVRPT